MYIKTFDIEDNITGAEKVDPPVFVRWQESNGLMVRCEQAEAQAIISEDGSTYYLLNGYMPHGEREPYAEFITEEEYRQIIDYDPEDDDPDIPEGDDEDDIYTRAELTAMVRKLRADMGYVQDALIDVGEALYGE